MMDQYGIIGGILFLLSIIVGCKCGHDPNHPAPHSTKVLSKDERRLVDFDRGEEVLIECYSVDGKGDDLRVDLLNERDGNIMDSLMFTHLLYPAHIDVIDRSFLVLRFPVRAGMGTFIEKTIFLMVLNEKLITSLDLITTEEIWIGEAKENYDLTIQYANFKIELEELYIIGEEERIRSHSTLYFHKEKGVFYTNLLPGPEKDSIPIIQLEYQSYKYRNGDWSMWNDE